MEQHGLFKRYELFVAAATIAAHAHYPQEGFRQKHVRFGIELISNWVGGIPEAYPINNTQILRYLDDLVNEGFAKRTIRKKWPWYRLTRVGLIELVSRLVNLVDKLSPEQFFFLHYFIENYEPRLSEMIKAEGKQFPLSLKLELEALLDSRELIQRSLIAAQRRHKAIDGRIRDSTEGARLARKLYAQGLTSPEVAREVEKLYPYEMNSQKPLSELFEEIPRDLSAWELQEGNILRAEQIWTPMKKMFGAYIDTLEKMLAQSKSKSKA